MRYEKTDALTHIRKRPDMYIGNPWVRRHDKEWVCEAPGSIRPVQDAEYSDGLLRIVVEVLSNAVDNVWRSRERGMPCTRIEFSVDTTTGSTRVWNDGLTIPVVHHEHETDVYIPELVFGHLLTSSNFDDEEKRQTSGRNGYGVKLTNVFSRQFSVETFDVERGVLYTQQWSENMHTRFAPKIRERKKKKGYTEVTFLPDFAYFRTTGYGDVLMGLFARLCYDLSFTTGLPVYWQGEKVHIQGWMQYVSCYPALHDHERVVFAWEDERGQRFDVGVASSVEESGGAAAAARVCFTNGVYNADGGPHMDKVEQEISKGMAARLTKKLRAAVTPREVRAHILVFLHARVYNPGFQDQSKSRLTHFDGMSALAPTVPEKVWNAIMRWSFVDRVREAIETRRLGTLVRTEKKTKTAVPRIEGFDRANLQGHPKHRAECTLILCEGLSAKTYAVTGIETGWKGRRGRDWFGIYALRGKLPNVRNATADVIAKNKELGDIIKILGLRIRGDYADDEAFGGLAYGRVLIITDADSDGVHIASLLLNFFHTLFPSLLHRDFLYLMMTPIAKVFFSPSNIRVCYSDHDYHKLIREAPPGAIGRVKYYKGLGTSNDEEIHATFGQKVVRYVWDREAGADLEKAFHKKNADLRKQWLTAYDPEVYVAPENDYPVSAYINQELVRFSIDNCRRSLPSIFDGLKLSQRKILYAAFKRHLFSNTKSMKVAQLAGYVAEHSNYHHGEQCLHDTIVRMAHDFVGSNNMPYFIQDGQFGSRSHHGSDAANARYIFTRLHPHVRQLFPVAEDELLEYTPDDGERVEPEYYIPVLPMILVNGCTAGIGTGWSCSVPCYNPGELREKIKAWVHNGGSIAPDEINNLVPYYHGFRGRIERVSETRYISHGAFEEMPKTKGRSGIWLRITEIPVSVSTDRYKEFLEEMVEQKKLRRMLNYSKPNTVDFHIEVPEGFVPDHDTLGLKSPISLTNMVLFSEKGRLQKYPDLHSVFHTFCVARMALYARRRAREKEDLLRKRSVLRNKLRFLVSIHTGELRVARVPEAEIVRALETGGYDRQEGSYAYLLDIPVRWFSEEKIRSLRAQIAEVEAAIVENEALMEGDRWIRDLNQIELPMR